MASGWSLYYRRIFQGKKPEDPTDEQCVPARAPEKKQANSTNGAQVSKPARFIEYPVQNAAQRTEIIDAAHSHGMATQMGLSDEFNQPLVQTTPVIIYSYSGTSQQTQSFSKMFGDLHAGTLSMYRKLFNELRAQR